jgi:hypothetical protein
MDAAKRRRDIDWKRVVGSRPLTRDPHIHTQAAARPVPAGPLAQRDGSIDRAWHIVIVVNDVPLRAGLAVSPNGLPPNLSGEDSYTPA